MVAPEEVLSFWLDETGEDAVGHAYYRVWRRLCATAREHTADRDHERDSFISSA